ncbi:MAG: acyl-CoA dehydratase activase [Clostridiales Family XIII bacterium]|nr:acyl-CoA dehydratase activase [Clostridiales Family XIII bacterium]
MFVMGTDIGSATSKCVILDESKTIRGRGLAPGGAGTEGPQSAAGAALAEARISRAEIARAVATGYGRNIAEGRDETLSELSCHAFGAHELFPNARTVVDIGGQDAKILRVSAEGRLESFVMNDKCAAGTGRFLENISRVLDVRIEDMAAFARLSEERIDISSTCAVFAESEIVSQLARGASRNDVLGAVFRSVAARAASLAKRLGVVPEAIMTGGVAKNDGVREALEEELGVDISVSPLAQYAGALGAAVYALRGMRR